MTSSLELRQVYLDNVRNNQIGGQNDGISVDTASDLGFQTREEVVELMKQSDQRQQLTRRELSSSEKNANAKKAVAEHLKRVVKQQIDPGY